MGLSDIMWYEWIQNTEQKTILMCMFPINYAMALVMMHFHKHLVDVGLRNYFAPVISLIKVKTALQI